MANANAIVEKMATIGLRHGEKAGVAIAVTVFLVCVSAAISREGIKTTPEEVKKAAQVSDQNLNRKEEPDAIIAKLENDNNIKPTHFAAAVEEQIKVKLAADDYRPFRSWVTPEPGAGLIRDRPDLVAPEELYAYAGRGGLLVYALDEEGNRILAPEDEEPEKKEKKWGNTKRRRQGGMGGRGGGMGMGGGRKKKRSKSKAEIEREEKEDRERQERQLKAGIVGGPAAEETKKDESESQEDNGPWKEVTKGYRWVAITGTLNHGQMLENYKKALKNPAIAHPQYVRLDLERRAQQPDGTWSGWQKVDAGTNFDIIDNVPLQEEELAPENVRPEGLVDRLPFLTAGLWEKVHIGSLVPKEKQELPEEPKNQGRMAGMGGSSMGSGMMQMEMMKNMSRMGNMGGGSGSEGMSMMPGSMGGMMGMGRMMGMGGGGEAQNFWKSEEKTVMVRALDFTVEPNNTYRYRVRVVVANPNYKHDDVNHGVDKESKYLEGPWSKETDIVTMPPDVQPYVAAAFPPSGKSDTTVRFQVIRFNPADGWTVPHRADATVGQLVGEPLRAEIPKSDGSGTKTETIDFSSCQIVLDIKGAGLLNLPQGLVGPSIDQPVYCALLRPDGAMVVHNQADDLSNEFRRVTESTYSHELKESNDKKKREHSQGGMSGMMGSMMRGMMGGGSGRGGARGN